MTHILASQIGRRHPQRVRFGRRSGYAAALGVSVAVWTLAVLVISRLWG